jgi:hypothetical protein
MEMVEDYGEELRISENILIAIFLYATSVIKKSHQV